MAASRRDYDKGNRIMAELYGAAGPVVDRSAAPTTINVDSVRVIARPFVFSYRRRTFVVRKVPWLDGCILEHLRDSIQERLAGTVTREMLLELEQLFLQAYALMWRWTEKRWWQRRNPFDETMGIGEFYAIVDFYSECRTVLLDLSLDTTMGSNPNRPSKLPKTLRTFWRNFPSGSRRGSGGTDSPSTIISFGSDRGGFQLIKPGGHS